MTNMIKSHFLTTTDYTMVNAGTFQRLSVKRYLFVLQCFLSLMMIIPGNIGSLIDFFSFTAWMFYLMAFSSLIVLRFTKKDAPRPYKVTKYLHLLQRL